MAIEKRISLKEVVDDSIESDDDDDESNRPTDRKLEVEEPVTRLFYWPKILSKPVL